MPRLIPAFKTSWASKDVAAIVLTGAGDKAFCAGPSRSSRPSTAWPSTLELYARSDEAMEVATAFAEKREPDFTRFR